MNTKLQQFIFLGGGTMNDFLFSFVLLYIWQFFFYKGRGPKSLTYNSETPKILKIHFLMLAANSFSYKSDVELLHIYPT